MADGKWTKGGKPVLVIAADAGFNEGDHPRAENGQFGSGGGSSGGKSSSGPGSNSTVPKHTPASLRKEARNYISIAKSLRMMGQTQQAVSARQQAEAFKEMAAKMESEGGSSGAGSSGSFTSNDPKEVIKAVANRFASHVRLGGGTREQKEKYEKALDRVVQVNGGTRADAHKLVKAAAAETYSKAVAHSSKT